MFRLDQALLRLLFDRADAQSAVDVDLHDRVGVPHRHHWNAVVTHHPVHFDSLHICVHGIERAAIGALLINRFQPAAQTVSWVTALCSANDGVSFVFTLFRRIRRSRIGGDMARGREWTGFEAAALQEAMRYSVRDFAEMLGVESTTVTNWRTGLSTVTPRTRTQAILDTAYRQRATVEDRERFDEIVAEGEAAWRKRHGSAQQDAATDSAPPVELASIPDTWSALDDARSTIEATLISSTVSPGLLDLLDERVDERIATYTSTSPSAVLTAVVPELLEIRRISAQRQPANVQARLSRATAVLALLVADALMKMGRIGAANHWYGTARLAADDTGNRVLRARARVQHAMLPYYYGYLGTAVKLARDAQEIAAGITCDATALAAASEARALARSGDNTGAESALARAQQLTQTLDASTGDEAFRFTYKRLLLYMSGTLTYMGHLSRAREVQAEALTQYRRSPNVLVDPALIELDAAVAEAIDGLSRDACTMATNVLSNLPAEQHTRIVVARAADVITAIPAQSRSLASAAEL
ncbi:hypothetical protein, partial [Nocardia veterana]